jgi:AmmeMemoRadiSam system protein B
VENPKIRLIEAIPVTNEGVEMILLGDTLGITENRLIVSKDAAFLMSLMDGTRSLLDLQAEYLRAFGEIIYMDRIRGLVETLDSNFFLQSHTFEEHFEKLRRECERATVRKAHLAGKSYPEGAGDLLAYLNDMFPEREAREHHGEITGILAPHIDYERGKTVYRETYAHLKGVDKPLLIVFGTCHLPTERICSISSKDFATPLGILPNAKGLSTLIRENSTLRDYIEEWPHRTEHSIELQLPLIQFMAAEHEVEILPILTGSMHEFVDRRRDIGDGEIEEILGALKEVIRRYGKPYLILTGADLAHIGAQFGDTRRLDSLFMDLSKQKDQALLEFVERVDAKGFFETVRDERDARRICGLTPIYFQLRLLEGDTCEIVSYDQWTDSVSSVSFAGGVFRKTV